MPIYPAGRGCSSAFPHLVFIGKASASWKCWLSQSKGSKSLNKPKNERLGSQHPLLGTLRTLKHQLSSHRLLTRN